MGLTSDQRRIAGELGERLAAGDETALEDIQAVLRPIILEGDVTFGLDVIIQIMFGMVAPSVFDDMSKRYLVRLKYYAQSPLNRLRDRTELAYIKKKLAPPKTREREWGG